jgi:predicted amidohydrolase
MKIGLAQMNIEFENRINNMTKCIDFIKEAKAKNVDFIIFPEMSLTGFSMNVELIGEKNNETVEWVKQKAVEFNIFIGIGHVASTENKGLNKFTIVSPQGQECCSYIKIHPFSYGSENNFYEGGTEVLHTQIKDFNVSPFICYDLRFPEIFQAASKEAHLITVAANWPKARRDNWITLLKARAIENQCYVAGVNAVGIIDGLEYSGDSIIVDPVGRIIAETSEKEGLVTSDIELSEVLRYRTSFPIKLDRKEALYRELQSKRR